MRQHPPRKAQFSPTWQTAGNAHHNRPCPGPYAMVAAPTPLFEPAEPVVIPVVGDTRVFPVRRVYCVGRNYEDHAKEMGFTGREPPFFFLKPGDTVLPVAAGQTGRMHYPSLTQNLHHEVELVVAIGKGGRDIPAAQAHLHVFGYAVGLDMTRRDLQNEMKKQGRPWCIGKAFEQAAPIGPITPAPQATDVLKARIALTVNGTVRQSSTTDKLIWSVAETIEHLSRAWTLAPGDLIYTGTPEGVGAVVAGDTLVARVDGLPELRLELM
jgi:fumarylpyruvate hydrolase